MFPPANGMTPKAERDKIGRIASLRDRARATNLRRAASAMTRLTPPHATPPKHTNFSH